MTKSVVAVWCGAGTPLVAQVHGMPLLRLVLKRCPPAFCLVPWSPDLSWLAAEIESWKYRVRRCHQDELIAMRDLVVDLGAEMACVVQGDCGSIDKEEIALAQARVEAGWEKYDTLRVKCFPRKTWLGFGDTDKWGPYPVSTQELQKRYWPTTEMETRWARLEAKKSQNL